MEYHCPLNPPCSPKAEPLVKEAVQGLPNVVLPLPVCIGFILSHLRIDIQPPLRINLIPCDCWVVKAINFRGNFAILTFRLSQNGDRKGGYEHVKSTVAQGLPLIEL